MKQFEIRFADEDIIVDDTHVIVGRDHFALSDLSGADTLKIEKKIREGEGWNNILSFSASLVISIIVCYYSIEGKSFHLWGVLFLGSMILFCTFSGSFIVARLILGIIGMYDATNITLLFKLFGKNGTVLLQLDTSEEVYRRGKEEMEEINERERQLKRLVAEINRRIPQ